MKLDGILDEISVSVDKQSIKLQEEASELYLRWCAAPMMRDDK